MKCTFCKEDIPEGRAKIFVTRTGKASHYCGSKCQRNAKTRKPFKVKWVTKEKKVKGEKKTVEKGIIKVEPKKEVKTEKPVEKK